MEKLHKVYREGRVYYAIFVKRENKQELIAAYEDAAAADALFAVHEAHRGSGGIAEEWSKSRVEVPGGFTIWAERGNTKEVFALCWDEERADAMIAARNSWGDRPLPGLGEYYMKLAESEFRRSACADGAPRLDHQPGEGDATMGVFDTVMVPCPVCGHAEEFQSKGGMCCLRTYGLEDAPDDVMSDVNRHSPCDCEKCGAVFSVDESARKAVLVSAAKPATGFPGDSAASSTPAPAPYVARPGWDEYFAEMARLASSRSTCNSSKVGAVIVRDRRVIATGYNGSLSGKANCCAEPGRCVALESPGKKYDNCPAVHAEANAVAQAALCGLSIAGADIYVTRRPCLICAKLLAASGVGCIHIVGGGGGEAGWSVSAADLVDRLLELSPAHHA